MHLSYTHNFFTHFVNIVDYSAILPAIFLDIQQNCQQYCWQHCSNIADNIVSNIADYAVLLLTILLINNMAGKIAANSVSNIADSAILLQYCQQYCWLFRIIAGKIVSNIASNIEPGPTSNKGFISTMFCIFWSWWSLSRN